MTKYNVVVTIVTSFEVEAETPDDARWIIGEHDVGRDDDLRVTNMGEERTTVVA